MNLSLSDEQEFLREAARGTLSRFKTFEAAREALDGNEHALPDLWPTACEAGWPGLLIDEAHGGAGLDAFDAMLVLGECGRVLAGVPLLGHLPATAILSDAPRVAEYLPALASGERRAAYLPSQPPTDLVERVERRSRTRDASARRSRLPSAPDDKGEVKLSGATDSCPTLPAPMRLSAWRSIDGEPAGVVIMACGDGVTIEAAAALRRHPLARARHAEGRHRDGARRVRWSRSPAPGTWRRR